MANIKEITWKINLDWKLSSEEDSLLDSLSDKSDLEILANSEKSDLEQFVSLLKQEKEKVTTSYANNLIDRLISKMSNIILKYWEFKNSSGKLSLIPSIDIRSNNYSLDVIDETSEWLTIKVSNMLEKLIITNVPKDWKMISLLVDKLRLDKEFGKTGKYSRSVFGENSWLTVNFKDYTWISSVAAKPQVTWSNPDQKGPEAVAANNESAWTIDEKELLKLGIYAEKNLKSRWKSIKDLQEKLGMSADKQTWKFDKETYEALIKFQKDTLKLDKDFWYVWPKTLDKLFGKLPVKPSVWRADLPWSGDVPPKAAETVPQGTEWDSVDPKLIPEWEEFEWAKWSKFPWVLTLNDWTLVPAKWFEWKNPQDPNNFDVKPLDKDWVDNVSPKSSPEAESNIPNWEPWTLVDEQYLDDPVKEKWAVWSWEPGIMELPDKTVKPIKWFEWSQPDNAENYEIKPREEGSSIPKVKNIDDALEAMSAIKWWYVENGRLYIIWENWQPKLFDYQHLPIQQREKIERYFWDYQKLSALMLLISAYTSKFPEMASKFDSYQTKLSWSITDLLLGELDANALLNEWLVLMYGEWNDLPIKREIQNIFDNTAPEKIDLEVSKFIREKIKWKTSESYIVDKIFDGWDLFKDQINLLISREELDEFRRTSLNASTKGRLIEDISNANDWILGKINTLFRWDKKLIEKFVSEIVKQRDAAEKYISEHQEELRDASNWDPQNFEDRKEFIRSNFTNYIFKKEIIKAHIYSNKDANGFYNWESEYIQLFGKINGIWGSWYENWADSSKDLAWEVLKEIWIQAAIIWVWFVTAWVWTVALNAARATAWWVRWAEMLSSWSRLARAGRFALGSAYEWTTFYAWYWAVQSMIEWENMYSVWWWIDSVAFAWAAKWLKWLYQKWWLALDETIPLSQQKIKITAQMAGDVVWFSALWLLVQWTLFTPWEWTAEEILKSLALAIAFRSMSGYAKVNISKDWWKIKVEPQEPKLLTHQPKELTPSDRIRENIAESRAARDASKFKDHRAKERSVLTNLISKDKIQLEKFQKQLAENEALTRSWWVVPWNMKTHNDYLKNQINEIEWRLTQNRQRLDTIDKEWKWPLKDVKDSETVWGESPSTNTKSSNEWTSAKVESWKVVRDHHLRAKLDTEFNSPWWMWKSVDFWDYIVRRESTNNFKIFNKSTWEEIATWVKRTGDVATHIEKLRAGNPSPRQSTSESRN